MKKMVFALMLGLFVVGCQPKTETVVIRGEKGADGKNADPSRLDTLAALIDLNSQKDALLEARVASLEGKMNAVESSLSTLQQQMTDNQAVFNQAIVSLQAADAQLAQDLAALVSRVSSLEASQAVQDGVIAGLQDDVADLKSRMSAVENKNVSQDTAILNLQTSLTTLQAQVTENTNNITNLQNSVQNITTNITNLTNQISSLPSSSNYNDLLAQITALSNTVSGLTTQVGSNTNNINGLQSQINQAASSLAGLTQTVAGLQDKTVEIINTCADEKLMKIGGKIYGVYFKASVTSVVTNSTCNVLGLLGGLVCVGLNNSKTNVNNVTGVYFGEIPNGAYQTTTGTNDCTFTVNNGTIN